MQLKDVIQKSTQFLRDKGSTSPRLDTELLISTALKWERIKLYLNYEYPLSEEELSQCREFIRRRATGEPVAYILGKKDFFNQSFKVSPAVLVPRPETETLVEQAIAFAKGRDELRVIDLGTGSGCIGLSVLANVPFAKLLAIDISPAALEIARTNAKELGVEERAVFLEKDASQLTDTEVEQFLGGKADVLLANPPYIDPDDRQIEPGVKNFEPASALFSPEQGLSHIRSWATTAGKLIKPQSLVMFEIGYDQGSSARDIFRGIEGFQDAEIVKDLADQDRFIRAFKAEENQNG